MSVATRRLPLVLAPADDESLSSYVARMASGYAVSTADMLVALGLCDAPTGRLRIAGYGTLLAPDARAAMQHATGLAPDAIAAMLLSRYHGLAADLSALDHDNPATFLEVTRREWLLFRTSRLCPECLQERNGAWRLSWKLPWHFACLKHARLLLERCPTCGHEHGHGTSDSCLPPYTARVPEPLSCANRAGGTPAEQAGSGAGDTGVREARGGEAVQTSRSASREPCGALLSELPTLDITDSDTLTAQAVLDEVLSTGAATVAGQRVSALEYLGEARSLYSLLLHHGRADDVAPTQAQLAEAVAQFYLQLDKLRSGESDELRSGESDELRAGEGDRRDRERGGQRTDTTPAQRKRHVVMYRRTLTNVAVMAALAPVVTRLLASASPAALSEGLGELASRVYNRHGGRLGLQQYYGVSPRLEAALLAAMPRRRSRVWVKSELTRLEAPAIADVASLARVVPPMLWPDVWQQHFAELVVTRADWPARRFLSMQLVKLATQCSWDAAAAALGYDDMQPGVAVGYVCRATREQTVDALRRAADEVLGRLVAGDGELRPGLVDYRARSEAFAGMHRIESSAWRDVLALAGARDTPKRRYSAAIWLWSELTGGYPTDAPGWADTPKRALEMYRQFLTDALPAVRGPLLDHGRALLAQAGDSHPHRVELALLR